MSEPLQLIERDIHEISGLAAQMLSLTSMSDGTTSPTRYQSVIHLATELRDSWARHTRAADHVFPIILSYDRHFADYLNRMEHEQTDLQARLDALVSANWPRSAQVGLYSVRIRAVETLTLVLRHLEQERTTILPLLRRWAPAKPAEAGAPPREESVISQLASV